MSKTYVFSNNDGRWLVGKIDSVMNENVGCDVYNLETENDNSYIAEGVVVHNCQIKELSKGKILDAALRPLIFQDEKGRKANVYFCDLLLATDRKHESLVKKIASGKISTLSMGTVCNWITCSKCGKALGDDAPNCRCLEKEMLQPYKTKDGEDSIVSELCGRVLWDEKEKKWVGDPESNKFIEISWVEHPAFTGAVLNHYVSDITKEAKQVLAFPTWRLQEAVDDIFKLRVADKRGMMVLNVARAELLRRNREAMIERIARSVL
jgi:hypothetical protein